MNHKIKYYVKWLIESNYKEDFIEGAFQLFIDNRINDVELVEILKQKDYELPKSFFKLSKFEQKKYNQHLNCSIDYVNGEFVEKEFTVFCRPYLDYLVKMVENDKNYYSEKIINYLLSLESYNFFFFGIEFVKITNTSLIKIIGMKSYLKEHKEIKTVYDLFVNLIPVRNEKNSKIDNLRNKLINYLQNSETYNLDVYDELIFFYLVMERLLSNLPKKEKNTIKMKCLIIDKKFLKEDEYYQDSKKTKRIYVKDYLNKADKELLDKYRSIFESKFLGIDKNNSYLDKELLKRYQPNGYSTLFEIIRGEIYGR